MPQEEKESGASSLKSTPENTELEKLQKELQRKEQELHVHREKIRTFEEQQAPERDTKHEIEKIKERESIPSAEQKKKVSSLPPAPKKKKEFSDDLKAIMDLDKPKQVKALIHIAFHKGIHHAVSIGEALGSPYLLDEFHDTLVNELYQELVKRKKLKVK